MSLVGHCFSATDGMLAFTLRSAMLAVDMEDIVFLQSVSILCLTLNCCTVVQHLSIRLLCKPASPKPAACQPSEQTADSLQPYMLVAIIATMLDALDCQWQLRRDASGRFAHQQATPACRTQVL